MIRAAAVQMSSGDDVDANLRRADNLLAAAAADDCTVAVLPENFALMPGRDRDKARVAEHPMQGPIQQFLRDAATRHGLWIVGGSIPLISPDAERVFGACPIVSDEGEFFDVYRKIHLFDVRLPDTDEAYQESKSMYPGDDPCAVQTPLATFGLTICYDLRFPELYRQLTDAGAAIFTVPAAFTRATGEAHWETLLRARAIENLAFVIAAGQTGTHPDGRATWGHSMIVDPWGKVLAELADAEGIASADLDLDRQRMLRQEFPVLNNRRL